MADEAAPAAVVINGWRVFAHPLFLDQLEALIADVEALRRKDPKGMAARPPASTWRQSPG